MSRSIPLSFVILVSAAACTQLEPIAFDKTNDAHCELAFMETEVAAREDGADELAKDMTFRAQWAHKSAQTKGITLTPGQENSLKHFLESGAREGSESTIACRHRQNGNPNFPRDQVFY